MFRDYLRFTLRHFSRSIGFSIIRIIGLALGMTCFLMISFFVLEELSYDAYHPNRDRIYRVGYAVQAVESKQTDSLAWVSSLVGPQLKKDFPEVEEFCRIRNTGGTMVHNGNRSLERNLFFADGEVFKVFNFPFIKGNPASALADPYAVVLTRSMASRYFGDQWASIDLSQMQLEFYVGNDTLPLHVTGIIQDIPQQSHFTFDALISYKTREVIYNFIHQWFALGTHTYILVNKNLDEKAFTSKISGMVMRYYGEEAKKIGYELTLFLQPLMSIHLFSKLEREIQPNGEAQHVYIFGALGIFILVLAIINFVNLSTAQSTRFGKQTGVRKISGSTRFQLIRLFMFDAFFYCATAGLISLGIVELIFPFFNQFLGRELPGLLDKPFLYGVLFIGLVFLVTLAGGAYPAKLLSSVKPIAVLKGYRAGLEMNKLRYALIVFQFVISIIFTIGALTIYRQMDFMLCRSLGFDKENVMVIDSWMNPEVRNRPEVLMNELAKLPGVLAVTGSQSVPGHGLLERTSRQEGSTHWTVTESLITKPNFLDVYGFELSTGRSFSADIPSDESSAFIINQSAARAYGWTDEDAIGKHFEWGSAKSGKIIGVLKDFHYRSLHERIKPVVVHLAERGHGYISIRLKDSDMGSLIGSLEEVYKRLYPDEIFQYFILDDQFDLQYASDTKLGTLAFVFCGLAFFIACIGLIALSAMLMDDKRKEIGIRKTLGASAVAILIMLNRKFVLLVIVAVLLASPIAFLLSERWLENFAYRTEVDLTLFFYAGLIAVLISLVTVSYYTLRASIVNPVDTLKYE
jgi:putative ABC transport system permease protein